MSFTRATIKDIVRSTDAIRSANTVGVDGNSRKWGMLWADVIVNDTLSTEQKRKNAGDIVSSAFPDVDLVAVHVGEDEKGYNYLSPKGKDIVSVIFNISGHKHYDARIHKDLK